VIATLLFAVFIITMLLGVPIGASLGLAGAAAMALSFGALVVVLHHAPHTAWLFSLAVVPLGVGLGLLFPVLTVVSQRSAAPQHVGVATATPLMLRALGGALGISALGAVLSHGMAASPVPAADALAMHLQTVFALAALVSLLALAAAAALPRRVPPLKATAPQPA